MKFQSIMAEKMRGFGGGRGPTATNNFRGNDLVLPFAGGLSINTTQDGILTPAEDLLLLQPEKLWLDLASDMSTFIELDQIPEVTQEDKEEILAAPGSLILPHLVRDLGLKEDEQEEIDLMQAANMKILDQYRSFIEGDDIVLDDAGTAADDSMDSFASDLDSNQSLIEEVETYLQDMSGVATSILTSEELKPVVEVEKKALIPAVTREEGVIRKQQQGMEDNSRILKALVAGKILASADSFEDSFTSSIENSSSFELTEEDLANAYTTTIKTENGQDVIIIIAQPNSPASRYVPDMLASSPSLGSPAYASSSCSDYEWSPSFQQQQSAQRKKYQRKNRPTLLSEPYPRDKVERKKAQNRTAAFRYREKKKAEQDAWDTEICQLEARNTALKAKLRDLEQELRTVKRLMVDTGLGHYLHAGPAD